MKRWECTVMAWVLCTVGAGGCSKDGSANTEAALTAAAVKAIEQKLQKPEIAYCEIKVGEGMTSRNVAESPIGPRLDSICRKEDASQPVQACWSVLKEHKVGFPVSQRFPECLTLMDGRVYVNDGRTTGLRFRCGELSKVAVRKLETLEPARVRVTYSVDAKKDESKVNAVERACGEVSVVSSEEKTALLLKSGDIWTLAGQ